MLQKSYILLLVFLGICLQAKGQPLVSVILDKDTVDVGEEFSMTLKISDTKPLGRLSINYSPIGEITNLAMNQDSSLIQTDDIDIEWLESPFGDTDETTTFDTEKLPNGKYELTQKLRLRVWDFGYFSFPHPTYMDASTKDTLTVRALQARPLLVRFAEDGIPSDTTQVINPNVPISKESRNWKDFLWLIIVIAFLLAALLLSYLQSRRKKRNLDLDFEEQEETGPKLPAHITALQKLEILREKRLWETGEVKEYQSKLTYVIREYLENRFEIQGLESTTSEIVSALENKDFDQSQNESLTRILQVADLVKFAKAKPTDSMHAEFLDEAFKFVEDTKQEIIEENQGEDGSE